MTQEERRAAPGADRRRVPRGGRRAGDLPGEYPPIVVADSYAHARVACARYLRRYGFKVIEADNAQRAVSAIASARPHVIIAELEPSRAPVPAPGEQVASAARMQDIPLIAMSTGLVSQPSDFDRYGAAAVLLKPFRLTRMLREVRRVLRGRAASSPVPVGPAGEPN